jgi:hypothetical protein
MNPIFEKEVHTIGDFIRAVLSIGNKEEAAEFYQDLLQYISRQKELSDTPENIAKANIGWCFGEGMSEDRRAIWREVCGAAHPIFGSMKNMEVSPEEAFEAGRR